MLFVIVTAKEVPVEDDTSVQGILRAQRRIECKARNNASVDTVICMTVVLLIVVIIMHL